LDATCWDAFVASSLAPALERENFELDEKIRPSKKNKYLKFTKGFPNWRKTSRARYIHLIYSRMDDWTFVG